MHTHGSAARPEGPDISLEDARAIVVRAIDKAEYIGVRGAVAVVGASGVLVSASRLDRGGAGGMPISDTQAVVIGGVAASVATIGPFVDHPGADPRKLIADRKPANGQDLLVRYALRLPYAGQHGDDEQRWLAAYGALPDEPGLGMAESRPGLAPAGAPVGPRAGRPRDRRGP